MGGDVEDKTAHDEDSYERGTAVRDEWKRQAGKRDHTAHREHVNKRLQNNDDGESERDQTAEEIARVPRYDDAARRERDKKEKQKDRADESGFLGEHREYRVTGWLRQVIKFFNALSESSAEKAAAPDGDKRLLYLVSTA